MTRISKDEKRFLRREFINDCLHRGCKTLSLMKKNVRLAEYLRYGVELKVYK